MRVPRNVLQKLKCIQCNYYLSCGPVFTRNADGRAICGRCTIPNWMRVNIRNKLYEAAAELLHFPCKYVGQGCKTLVKYSPTKEESHEEICSFKKCPCPIAEYEPCSWSGFYQGLLQHFMEMHPQTVLENCCNIPLHVNQSTRNIYLIVAFNVSFIVYVEVSTTLGKLYYSINLIEEAENTDCFKYLLKIKRKTQEIKKRGIIEALRTKTIQETSLHITIETLLEILDDDDDIKLELKIIKIEEDS